MAIAPAGTTSTPSRAARTVAVALIALGAAAALRLSVGSGGLAFPDSPEVWDLRLTRVGVGAVAGAALALAGVLLQCLLRNPLASPDLMGLAGGSGLAVCLWAFMSGVSASMLSGPGAPAASLVGACAALATVLALSRRRGIIDTHAMILVGVMVGIFCGAGIMFLQHLMPERSLSTARLLIGALDDNAGWPRLAWTTSVVALVSAVALAWARAMDAASLGDDEARSVGVPIHRLRMVLFLGSGVLTAVAVVLAGPIGFIGLVAPHLCRWAAGPAHRAVIVSAGASGAALVVGADAIVKGVELAQGRMPLGVLTALLGGPVFIAMLRSRPREV